ncbi:hypothetical protein GCM10023235_78890 [Kitasatospora terrestris]|uniref:Uncharacterized protein n=1 Tax=Kitasatospora terrestris TaxID=258051 RepID=A0ABP9D7B5_9ACTN
MSLKPLAVIGAIVDDACAVPEMVQVPARTITPTVTTRPARPIRRRRPEENFEKFTAQIMARPQARSGLRIPSLNHIGDLGARIGSDDRWKERLRRPAPGNLPRAPIAAGPLLTMS